MISSAVGESSNGSPPVRMTSRIAGRSPHVIKRCTQLRVAEHTAARADMLSAEAEAAIDRADEKRFQQSADPDSDARCRVVASAHHHRSGQRAHVWRDLEFGLVRQRPEGRSGSFGSSIRRLRMRPARQWRSGMRPAPPPHAGPPAPGQQRPGYRLFSTFHLAWVSCFGRKVRGGGRITQCLN